MVDRERWCEAQNYERNHWERVIQRLNIEGSTLDWYDWKAKYIMDKMGPYLDLSEARVLEIGSGPIGIVTFIRGRAKFSIDPLETFYRMRPSLTELRDKHTTYLGGVGEALPFREHSFDFIILDNVLDHCQNPELVLGEINRTLRVGGFLYFMMNLHTGLGCLVRSFFELFRVDKGHPFTFSVGATRSFLGDMNLMILYEEIEDYKTSKKKNISSKHRKRMAKAILGASQFQYKAVCRRIAR